MTNNGEPRRLIAYHARRRPAPPSPAPRWRDWMNATDERSANRCLPLLVANEAGWVLNNPAGFQATWNGGSHPSAVTIEFDDEALPAGKPAESHFGYGVITWNVGYLFRTPPGWNLLVRGPANWPKDGICALEGIVETDWSVATFTMNWKLTRAGHPVRFEKDEPFCMLVPQRRGDLESFRPEVRDIKSDPATCDGAKQFVQGRAEFHKRKFLSEFSREYEAYWSGWQRHYFKGQKPDGSPAPEHQTKIRLSAFGEPDG